MTSEVSNGSSSSYISVRRIDSWRIFHLFTCCIELNGDHLLILCDGEKK